MRASALVIFSQVILNQIASKAHFIVILTPSALERCNELNDWLRKEIEHALDLKRNIIPLMFDKFEFEAADKYLTGKLQLLKKYNGLEIPIAYFDEALTRLRSSKFLDKTLDTVLHPTPTKDVAEVERKTEVADEQPAPSEAQLTAEEYFERAYNRPETDYGGKIADYTKALHLNPQNAQAYNNRGNARRNKGDYDGAIADYTEALRLNPQNAQAYNNRGNARSEQGDIDAAIANYDEALRLYPQYAEAYNNRGNARRNKGDYEGAIADYTEALSLYPQYAEAYYNRGNVHYSKGDTDAAIADYDEALRLSPQFAEAYYNRGAAYSLKGNHTKTLANFKQANDLLPKLPTIMGGLAITYYTLNETPRAFDLWRELLKMDERYKDADWAGEEFNWRPKLIAEL